ncbi:MAG: hypothetical protein KA792_05350 [Bacteroidales bacterium]|nr:hypothetical protein [Bacteroidales bacterium]
MKTINMIIIQLFLISTISISQISTKVYSLKGRVKSMSETKYMAVGKDKEMTKGRMLYEMHYKFDKMGNETKIKNSNLDKDKHKGKVLTGYEYNKDGKIVRIINYSACRKDNIIKFIYDEKGRKIIKENFNGKDKKLLSKTNYKYDDKNNLTELISDDSLFYRTRLFQYDVKGNKTQESQYDKKDNLLFVEQCKYDDKGNKIEESFFEKGDKLTFRDEYKYDNKGNLTEKYRYSSGNKLIFKTVYKYDEYGNELEKNECYIENNNCNKTVYRYDKIDKQGNWLVRVTIVNDFNEDIVYREIKYY